MSMARTSSCAPVRLGAGAWLALHALALWPHGLWMVRRMADGSDDPLGAAALAALATWLWFARDGLRATPRLPWLGTSGALTAAATASLFAAPPLLAAGLATLALAAHLAAWLPDRSPRLALAGLMLLALPLVASLQFYAGYPLRVFTAQFSAWLLQAAGVAAERSGASMVVAGQLVIVDAPCSGVQMAWLAYFAACAVAAFTSRRDGALARRLPLVGLTVLAGNVVRNTLLVALEAGPGGLTPAWHEAIGLGMVLCVVVLVVRIVAPRRPATGVAA